jgi:hypothetical protein
MWSSWAVGDEDGPDALLLVPQVAVVGDDEVHPVHVRLGEHQAGVYDQDVLAVLHGHHIFADFPQSSQGDDAQVAHLAISA